MWLRDIDDWSGVTNKQQRKRIQNRRNQRTYRAKKRAACNDELEGSNQDASVQTQPLASTALVYRQSGPGLSPEMSDEEAVEAVIRATSSVNILAPDSELNRWIMQRFEEYAVRNYVARSQKLNILPSLSQFNFIRALLTNVDVLGLSAADMHDDALSPFNVVAESVRVSSQHERLSQLPMGLRPTDLQRGTPHHPWIDLLPIPAMRDNIFRPGFDSFDEEQLCHDMRGAIPGQNPGVLVWGDPWDADSWEVTEEFVKSWGWVVANCWDLLRSTNRWRTRRGEEPLFFV
ncbi:hypothetical protein SAMD00023353_0503150 [Rosellinia necatrix]|uniref:BZIP domain-containing protein n=1 Tax=Rosellinia necatrix TaxID=77044 RepID=A0A1S7UKV4_ROSNE|nr:hypothetical protein SAMD00023353_0503150 [Rosellinia necatrix]